MKQKTVTFGYMHHNRLYYIAFSFNTWIILHSWMRCILQCSNQSLWFDWVGLDISQNDNKQFLFSFVFIPNQLQRFFFMINHLLIWIYIWTELIMGIQQRDMTWQCNLGIQYEIQHENTTWYTTWEYNPELISWEYYCPVKGEVGPSWWRAWVWGACPAVNTWSYLWC